MFCPTLFVVCAVWLMTYAPLPVFASVPDRPLPPSSPDAPDLQLLVMTSQSGNDLLNVTYGSVVPQQQVSEDLASIGQQIAVDSELAQVTNTALPVPGMETPAMTSVTVPVSNVASVGGGDLPVAQLVVALRRYRRLEITFIMPPDYLYNGARAYADKNVSIRTSQSGGTYTFNVTIKNSDFTVLSIPTPEQERQRALKRYETRRHKIQTERRLVGVIAISVAALFIGFVVYLAMSRFQRL